MPPTNNNSKKPNQFAKFAGTTGQPRPLSPPLDESDNQGEQSSNRLAEAINSTSRRLPGALLVKIDAFSLSPNQIRRDMDGPALEELINDIKERGILEPLLVRRTPDKQYEIVAGQRRYMAARVAGLVEVPVIIKEMDDQEARLVMLVENIQREELSPADERAFYMVLQNEFNYSIQEIAGLIHKSRHYVTRRLSGDIQSLQPTSPKAMNALALDSDNDHNMLVGDVLNNNSQAGTTVSTSSDRRAGSRSGSYNPVVFHKLSVSLGKTLRLFDDEETPPSEETLGEISQSVSEVEETLNQLKAKLSEASKNKISGDRDGQETEA